MDLRFPGLSWILALNGKLRPCDQSAEDVYKSTVEQTYQGLDLFVQEVIQNAAQNSSSLSTSIGHSHKSSL
jgi:hypothetical protein